MIQVLCKTPFTNAECKELMEKLQKRIRRDETDVHGGNVGYYRNRPVLFDW